jgi:hypothetical protein
MDYSIKDLIGMLNLARIIANGSGKDKVEIPKDAAAEMTVYLEELKNLLGE